MAALGRKSTKSTAAFAAAAIFVVVTPAFARGGGHGGGGHSSGGHFSGGSGGHFSGGSGGHVSAPHYSAPHYSAPSTSFHGPIGGVHSAAPLRGPVGGFGHGYVGGGRGAYVAGGRVPAFYGGPHGRVWWGPHYGWRVPAYWGGYYRPYGVYLGVGFWVTDWIMLDYLAAEEARMMAYGGPAVVAVPVDGPPLDGGVREELRAQIAEILSEPVPPTTGTSIGPGNTLVVNDPRVARALAAPHHVFVVSDPITVANRSSGGTCSLTAADLVRTSAPIPSGQSAADVTVAASKKASCPPGATVALPIADLVRFEVGLLERVARGAAAAKAEETEAPPTPPPSDPSGAAPQDAAPSNGVTPTPQDSSTRSAPPISGGLSL